jgi:hypothetical protein
MHARGDSQRAGIDPILPGLTGLWLHLLALQEKTVQFVR